jgi:hypothetical protein
MIYSQEILFQYESAGNVRYAHKVKAAAQRARVAHAFWNANSHQLLVVSFALLP